MVSGQLSVVSQRQSESISLGSPFCLLCSAFCLLLSAYCQPPTARGFCLLIFGATRAKTFTTQHRTPTRRLKRYGVVFAALVARNLEAFAFSAGPSRSTKIGPPRIATRLTAFWVRQVSFSIIFLFTFGKRKRGCTFRAGNFQIWHGAFLHEGETEESALSALRGSC